MKLTTGRTATVLSVLLSDALRHRLQTLTSLVGVAVGVAVVVAIHLASEAALLSFRQTYGSLAGAATHQVTGVEPLPAKRLAELLEAPGVLAAQPIAESTLVLPDAARLSTDIRRRGDGGPPRTLRLFGIDPLLAPPFLGDLALPAGGDHDGLFERFLTEPGLALVPPGDLVRLGLPGGGLLNVAGPSRRMTLRCLPLDAGPGAERFSGAAGSTPLAVVDIAVAQELLALGDRLTRIDLIVDETAKGDAAAGIPLASGERLQLPDRRGERAGSLTAAFRSNLLALGFLAVLVGSFLVFNMAQFAATRRRTLLGKLRCLGCPSTTLLSAVLLEAAVVGLLGGLAGLALGRLLSLALVDGVALTVSTLYGFIETPDTQLDALTIGGGLALAVGSAVLATWMPARSAARTPPALVAGSTAPERLPGKLVPLLFALAALAALLPPEGGLALQALGVLFILLSVAALVPMLLGKLLSGTPRGTLMGLATGRIVRSLGRTGATAGALVMPLAMTVGITVMIHSFQQEVVVWVDATVGADVYIKPLFQQLSPRTARLDDEILDALESWPGVREVDLLRGVEAERDGHAFLVAGSRLGSLRAKNGLRMLSDLNTDQAFARLEAGDVLISEPLHRKTGLGAGDDLELLGRTGPQTLRIAGVFQDFSYDRGYCLMEADVYLGMFGETGVRHAALLLEPGVASADVVADLSARFDGAEFDTPEHIHASVMQAFNDTFRVTWSLQIIATALAIVGVLTGLLCMHLERRHELGVLRALGSTTRTVGRLLLLEALILTSVVAALAVPVGALLAWVLIHVVNARSFGWTFPLIFAWGEVAALLGMTIVAALAAGVVPWLLVRRARIAHLLAGTSAVLALTLCLGTEVPAQAVVEDQQGFLRARPGRHVRLPADHAAHPATRTEWWYFTGPLQTADGQEFGFQATWFRRGLLPNGPPSTVPATTPAGDRQVPASPLRAAALMMFHGNLSEVATGRMTGTQRLSRTYEPWAHAATDRLDLRVFGNTLSMASAAAPQAQLDISVGDARLSLTLGLSASRPLHHGDSEGLSPKGHAPGQASWYYSLPRIPVVGTLTRPGSEPLEVRGHTWFDHEFGSSVLEPEQVGWDWFSVALDDGSDLMAFDLRRSDGSRDDNSACTLRTPDGNVLRLGPRDFALQSTGTWSSPAGSVYPARWTLDVPAAELSLTVSPRLSDQEVRGPGNSGVNYWEGLCSFEGLRAGQPVSGQGYVELVGYDGPFTTMRF